MGSATVKGTVSQSISQLPCALKSWRLKERCTEFGGLIDLYNFEVLQDRL